MGGADGVTAGCVPTPTTGLRARRRALTRHHTPLVRQLPGAPARPPGRWRQAFIAVSGSPAQKGPWAFAPFRVCALSSAPEKRARRALQSRLAEQPEGPGQAPVPARQGRLDVLIRGQVGQVAQRGHRGLPAQHLGSDPLDVLGLHVACRR